MFSLSFVPFFLDFSTQKGEYDPTVVSLDAGSVSTPEFYKQMEPNPWAFHCYKSFYPFFLLLTSFLLHVLWPSWKGFLLSWSHGALVQGRIRICPERKQKPQYFYCQLHWIKQQLSKTSVFCIKTQKSIYGINQAEFPCEKINLQNKLVQVGRAFVSIMGLRGTQDKLVALVRTLFRLNTIK